MAGRRTTSTTNLDNNLDALLDDLQTSVNTTGRSSSVTRQHAQTSSAQQQSSSRIIETSQSSRRSPLRSMSPARHVTTTTTTTTPGSGAREVTVEKYVSSGPAGTASGIPGLEMLDKELADVQPGQSKTVAYKQVSYHYDKSQEGKDLEPWMKTDKITRNDASIVDDFCERTFNQTSSSRPITRDATDYAKSNQEIIYKADVSSKTIPVVQPVSKESRQTERDFKYVKETSYRTEPSPISPRKNIKTTRTDETEELTNVEYIPASTPLPIPIPEPGPNTKVTTTIKTYTYEVPRTPQVTTTSSTTSTLNKNLEKSISYTSSLPREHVPERTVVHQIEEHQRGGVREYLQPAPSPTTSRVHREQKVYVEERRGYRAPTPPPPVTTTSTLTRSEKYLQESRSNNGYGPPPGIDYPDHVSRTTERVVYSSEPPPRTIPVETGSTTRSVKHYEEHYATGGRPPKPVYYPSSESHTSSTHVYKQYEESNLMPKPFPTSERPVSPRQEPPKRIDDLMSSFTESKPYSYTVYRDDGSRCTVHEVVEVMEKRDQRKGVDFVPHSPPVVQSKNLAGPPVYYPPGSDEFKKREEYMGTMAVKGGGEGWQKEESMSAMSKRSGGWEKERGAWEYGGSEKHHEKTKSKKAVVHMCLPLCCALPCSIM